MILHKNGIKSILRTPINSKQNFQITLLMLILLVLIFPYFIKGYNGYLKNKERKKEQIIQANIEAQRQLMYEENQKSRKLLTKYNITVLNANYPCRSEVECPFEIKIPEGIFYYLLGELKDKKLGSSEQCKKITDIESQEKYIIYCPDELFGLCPLNLEKYSSLLKLTPSPTPSLFDFLIVDLVGKGFDLVVLSSDDHYKINSYGMGKCDRLNFESKFQEFNKELPNIEKMVAKNTNNKMIKIFNERSYKNYLILKNELKNE